MESSFFGIIIYSCLFPPLPFLCFCVCVHISSCSQWSCKCGAASAQRSWAQSPPGRELPDLLPLPAGDAAVQTTEPRQGTQWEQWSLIVGDKRLDQSTPGKKKYCHMYRRVLHYYKTRWYKQDYKTRCNKYVNSQHEFAKRQIFGNKYYESLWNLSSLRMNTAKCSPPCGWVGVWSHVLVEFNEVEGQSNFFFVCVLFCSSVLCVDEQWLLCPGSGWTLCPGDHDLLYHRWVDNQHETMQCMPGSCFKI